MTETEPQEPTPLSPESAAIVEQLRDDLMRIQEGDRPLPWVVHTGSSYRRIASEPTREHPRSFRDGNVLHGIVDRHDGHHDLSMSEDQLNALVEIVNALPAILAALREQAPSEEMVERVHASLQREWDRSETLPPLTFMDREGKALARAAIAAMGGRDG